MRPVSGLSNETVRFHGNAGDASRAFFCAHVEITPQPDEHCRESLAEKFTRSLKLSLVALCKRACEAPALCCCTSSKVAMCRGNAQAYFGRTGGCWIRMSYLWTHECVDAANAPR
jgi:hypothetical protein